MLYLIYCIQQNAALKTPVPLNSDDADNLSNITSASNYVELGNPNNAGDLSSDGPPVVVNSKKDRKRKRAGVSSTSALFYISYLDNSCCILSTVFSRMTKRRPNYRKHCHRL
jgi:hypothetical protein